MSSEPAEPARSDAPEEELGRLLRYRRRLRWAVAAAAAVTLLWVLSELLLQDATLGLDRAGKTYFHVYALAPLVAAGLAAGVVSWFPRSNWFRALVVYSAMLAWGLPVSWQAMRGARVTKASAKLEQYQYQARAAWQELQAAQQRQDLAAMARSADQYARLMEQSAEAARGTSSEAHYRELADRTRRLADRGIEKAKLSRALGPAVELRPEVLASVGALDQALGLLGRYEQVVDEIDGLVARSTGSQRALGHQVRRLEVEQCRALVAALRVLREEFGRFTRRDGQFDFQRADAAQRFAENRARYSRATASLRRAQAELAGSQRASKPAQQ